MFNNETELTKNFRDANNSKNRTPKWVGWFHLIYLLGSIPGAAIIGHYLYSLKIFTPPEWHQLLDEQYVFIVIIFYFPIFALLMTLHRYLNKNFLTKELFNGETGYIIAFQNAINIKDILKISAKKIPPGTKIFIFAYNRQQEVKLSRRYKTRFDGNPRRETKAILAEAKAWGIDLNPDQYPIMNLERKGNPKIGNINLIKTIDLPQSATEVQLNTFLPDSLNTKIVQNRLLNPSYDNKTLTELVIRVTVHSKNECTASFEVFYNPMETAFAVEI